MPAPRPLRLRLWLRVIIDHLARWGGGEVADRALHPIALAGAVFRGHLVMIRRLWLETLQSHAEDRLRMRSVEPDMAFRRLAQILGIRPVMHDAIMLVEPARVRRGPPNNRHPGGSRLELRRFGDLDALG